MSGACSADVVNPATGRAFARCARADAAQLEAAVDAAQRAFSAWSTTPLETRRRALLGMAEALTARRADFAASLTDEQGKPLAQAEAEVNGAVDILRAFARLDLRSAVLRDDTRAKIVRQHLPLGVVAVITPWNYPLVLLMISLAPALLAGNTVIAKPAPSTPLTTLSLAALCAGILPPGVFNVIVDRNDLGDLITSHAGIARVAFTGSVATGRRVMASAAATIKRLTLELGGNDAAIVLDDVDVDEVATRIFWNAMANSGQVCLAVKRVYVPDHAYDAFCEKLAALARTARVGDGREAGTQLGPVQNRAHFVKLLDLLAETRVEGRIIAGGAALERDGYFIAPTIVRDIAEDSRLVREEQFGPVLPVLRYADLDDAIARANRTHYGLAASVWGRDTARAEAVAQRLAAGTVWVNTHLEPPLDFPFGGAKQSGLGMKMGQEGLESFTQPRIVHTARD